MKRKINKNSTEKNSQNDKIQKFNDDDGGGDDNQP